ncbi:MAG TPA: ATP-binding cassette domain-containing protein [Bacteroidales bacterium]|nr:ATP-binding cassette domain-containing protein [Bacteroidales bacterium]HSA43214.1 ATP-binding cassette domain-containing protein [Bacteroidales bacterium]
MEDGNIIEYEGVSVYQNQILILTNVNLTVKKGEFVYIIGRTGTGKTSLLKTMYAELPVVDGSASVAGYDLRKLKGSDIPYLRRRLGIVFQDFQLLTDRSVKDNLFFVMKATGWKDKKAMQERLHYVLTKVGLGTKGFKKPNQLSGGEQQRVGIARALINSPELILADEPTGNLDPDTSRGILSLLKEISSGGTSVLMATHDYSLFEKFPSRTLRCEGGHLTDNQQAGGITSG